MRVCGRGGGGRFLALPLHNHHRSTPLDGCSHSAMLPLVQNPHQLPFRQESAMREGTLLFHLHSAIFSTDEDHKILSRFLCAVWMDGSASAASLLSRSLPPGVINLLSELKPGAVRGDIVPVGETVSNKPGGEEAVVNKPGGGEAISGAVAGCGEEQARRGRREAFVCFFDKLERDHSGVGILWDAARR